MCEVDGKDYTIGEIGDELVTVTCWDGDVVEWTHVVFYSGDDTVGDAIRRAIDEENLGD